MARKRSHAKPRRRRRRKSSNRIHSVVIRGPSAFPDRVFVRLKYSNSFRLTGTGLNTLTFSGNAMNRPDLQQPTQLCRGLREWMNIYDTVKVHKSNISVDCHNQHNVATTDCVVLPFNEVAPSFVDTEDAREQPYAKSRRAGSRNGNTASVIIRNSMKTKTVFGTKFINDTYAGSLTSAPAEQWFWECYFQDLVEDTTMALDMEVSVTLTYFIELYERKFIPRSESPSLEIKA